MPPSSQRMRQNFGPPSKEVLLLSRFSQRRGKAGQPLSVPLPDLLVSQAYLYSFMQFLKAEEAIHVLQVYLSLNEWWISLGMFGYLW